MAVKIRLERKGKRNRPFYRIIAISDEKDGRGEVLENIGFYDPLPDPSVVEIKEGRLAYWLSVGAKPSPTVRSFLKRKGLLPPGL
ncbi:MAG: 30S ribosomal protein S16 [Candidatus Omnitrophica bacterium]|nr:30S ribosomal protein S16 [Candidatus Omnitrophota bacterium]